MSTDTPAATPAPDSSSHEALNDQIAQRLTNLEAWRADGVEPFGGRFDDRTSAADAKALYNPEEHAEAGPKVRIAGRMSSCRNMGKSIFADLRDSSDRIQVYVQKNVLGDERYAQFRRFDLGDWIGIEGEMFVTRTGEVSVKVHDFVLLSKALHPMPEKFHGLQDTEQRHRQRYLDLASNPDVMALFRKRFEIVAAIRHELEGLGFLEVETPMLQPIAGGAAARPFATHYNALNCRMFMRIAPELYLKRLLVGGFEKVFELNRNFRNEGLSRKHNPEFTMLELYQAYSDCEGMMHLIETLISNVAQKVLGTTTVTHAGGKVIDLAPGWRRVPYRDLILEHAGADWYDISSAERLARAQGMGLDVLPDWEDWEITHEIYEKRIEETLIQPTFVTRLPAQLVPLAKTCADDPTVVDVYELEINGQELSPGYSELNDPIEQRRRFEEQLNKEGETMVIEGTIDEDFLNAMNHGMPPAGGLGLGIDRLVMLLTGAESIREVILFPHLRPRSQG